MFAAFDMVGVPELGSRLGDALAVLMMRARRQRAGTRLHAGVARVHLGQAAAAAATATAPATASAQHAG